MEDRNVNQHLNKNIYTVRSVSNQHHSHLNLLGLINGKISCQNSSGRLKLEADARGTTKRNIYTRRYIQGEQVIDFFGKNTFESI